MRITGTFIFILAVISGLSACAPANRSENHGGSVLVDGSTGFSDQATGFQYITGGDDRIRRALEEEQRQEQPQQQQQESATPAPIVTVTAPADETVPLTIRERLKEFEISRYALNTNEPSRFGDSRFRIKFFQKDAKSIEFTGTFAPGTHEGRPALKVSAAADGYALSGHIEDLKNKEQSKGEFTLSKDGDTARVFYWAYRARMTVREDRENMPAAGSSVDQQIRSLRDNTFGWVHNWTVVRGRAFYMVDIVRIVTAGARPLPAPFISFKGESLQTGESVYEADVIYGPAKDVQLVGNAEAEAARSFAVTLSDPDTRESSEVMIDIDLDDQNTAPITYEPPRQQPSTETPGKLVTPPAWPTPRPNFDEPATEQPNIDPSKVAPMPMPAHMRPTAPTYQSSGDKFLKVNMSLSRTSKMMRDFDQNFGLAGVTAKINEYKNSRKTQLRSFYRYANPFRQIMETVGSLFDVSPVYAYLTIVESKYFYGGQYEIEKAPGSSALGPFQLLTNTASGNTVGMRTGGGEADERRYFVPSACGAARYMRYLVNIFDDSDSTLSILGYFQGEGGAAAAIYCVFDPGVANRSECVKKINKPGSGYDYGRFLRLAKSYNYSYAEMSRRSQGLTPAMRAYVDSKLAVYFISNNMSDYGFSVPSDAKTSTRQLGANARKTVMPTRALKDQDCQRGVSPVL